MYSAGTSSNGTGGGISYSTDGGASWTDYSRCYGGQYFSNIEITADNKVMIGGYKGVWKEGDLTVFADFTADNEQLCLNSEIVLSDYSAGIAESYTWNFGEGATPATQTGMGTFTVTYSIPGAKSVSLTVTGNSIVCRGVEANFSIASQAGVTYNWSFPPIWQGAGEGNTVTATPV